jgi:hypothetical protein
MTAARPRLTDLLTNIVVTFLTPMFLGITHGDLDQARAGALETVTACAARHPMDILLIGQMIALGLATLSSVSLSMDEDIPISFVLRLRGNAVSLHRAAETCRRALPEPGHEQAPISDLDREPEATETGEPETLLAPTLDASTTDAPQDFPESLDAMKAAMARIVAESDRRNGPAQASAAPSTTPLGGHTASERILRAALSYALPDAAPGVIDSLTTSTAEHHADGLRATAPRSTANQLLTPAPR